MRLYFGMTKETILLHDAIPIRNKNKSDGHNSAQYSTVQLNARQQGDCRGKLDFSPLPSAPTKAQNQHGQKHDAQHQRPESRHETGEQHAVCVQRVACRLGIRVEHQKDGGQRTKGGDCRENTTTIDVQYELRLSDHLFCRKTCSCVVKMEWTIISERFIFCWQRCD
jgi:hypothetical protein